MMAPLITALAVCYATYSLTPLCVVAVVTCVSAGDDTWHCHARCNTQGRCSLAECHEAVTPTFVSAIVFMRMSKIV